MMKTNFQCILSFLVGFLFMGMSSCKKDDSNYAFTSIKLNVSTVSNGLNLEWDKVNTTDFVRYEVYRSFSPIPEPTKDAPINSSLLISTISNSNHNFFLDSTSIGQSYYRVLVILKMRKLVSNQISNSNGMAVSGNFMSYEYDPESKWLYMVNATSQLTVLNLATNSVVFEKFPLIGYNIGLTKNTSNQTVLMVSNGSLLQEYNAQTLSFIKSHSILLGSYNFKVKNYHVYTVNSTNLLTYNLATDAQVGNISVPNCYRLYMSSSGNSIITTGFSSSDNVTFYSVGASGIPIQGGSTLDNTYFIYAGASISTNANYIVTSQNYVLNSNFVYITFLNNPSGGAYSSVVFTKDDNYMVGKTFNSIDIYSCGSTFMLKKSFPTTNVTSTDAPIFIDGNDIIIIESQFDSLTGTQITVVRKKTYEF